MSRLPLKSPRARLFIALELPGRGPGAGSTRWGSGELARPGAAAGCPRRSTSPSSSSATRRPSASARIAARAVCGSAGPAPRLELAPQPVALPAGAAGRACFALEVRRSGSRRSRPSWRRRSAEAGLYEPEERPFCPHVTVARVRPEQAAGRAEPRRVEEPPGALPEALRAAVPLPSGSLFTVRLPAAAASEYSPLAQVELPSGEAAVR